MEIQASGDPANNCAYGIALKDDGTVVTWGYGEPSSSNRFDNIIAIAAGGDHALAVRTGPLTPVIALQPVDKYDIAGDNVTFTSRGAGLYGVSYQWQVGGTSISGATNATLTLTNVQVSNQNYYNVVLSNEMGSQLSLPARFYLVTVPPPPVISYQPANQYQIAGGSATFQCIASAPYGSVSYQWQASGTNMPGATNSTLTLTNVQASSQNVYRVTVSNGGGSVTSSNANFYLVTPPTISLTPASTNQVVTYLSNVTLSVTASSLGQRNGFPISYQWKRNGVNLDYATASNYVFFVDWVTSTNTYSVIVSNAAGIAVAAWNVTPTVAGTYTAPGTLAYHLATNAVGRAAGYVPGPNSWREVTNGTCAFYSATNYNMGLLTNATWASSCWLHGAQGLTATAIGISNSFGAQCLLTMISPRHYARATHTGWPPGLIAFLDTNNVICWRTAIQQVSVGNDLDVGILDADVPASVGFVPVLPVDYTNYIPLNFKARVQGVTLNQDPYIFSEPMYFSGSTVNWDSSLTAPFGLGTNWSFTIRPGDSSNPEWLLIGNQLVLVSDHHDPGSGPNYAVMFDAIEQTMHHLSTNNNVGSDYHLTHFSLTNWPKIQ